ncbi:glycine cleavage system protein T [Oscillatoriales cyanobacterium USR001]|nr:glycine cleavage system protein T [Oscillatoriales cyanobacterium USR001]
MIQELSELQISAGAIFTSAISEGVPVSFGNDAEAILASKQGVVVCDRTHWGRLQISGQDRLRFLHNQTTNNFNILQPGEGCDTVFVTSTARTIDLATAIITEDSILLIVSPNRRQKLLELLDRYIFPMDKIELKDLTNSTATFSLIGLDSGKLLEKMGVPDLENQPYASHKLVEIQTEKEPVRIVVGSGLGTIGYTLICDANLAANIWGELVKNGAIPAGERVWEQLRIKQGRPATDAELTDEYNPLEARLLHTISYQKGCYIGQETIARLNTYKGVKQELWGVRLSGDAEVGATVTMGEEKVGKVTSFTVTDDGPFALAYIRTKAGGKGLKVQVGEVEGEVVDLPFLS